MSKIQFLRATGWSGPRHFAEFKDGKISEDDFRQIKERGCSGFGACPVMGTANTMACLAEALGMSLPLNATTPGADSSLMRLAFQAGRQVVRLHREGITPADIMTLDAFRNAIRILMAIGGSTNGVLHLQAIAAELDLEIKLETFNEISKETPLICDIAPSGSGRNLMVDFDEAGGLPAVMKELQPKKHSFSRSGQLSGKPVSRANRRRDLDLSAALC